MEISTAAFNIGPDPQVVENFLRLARGANNKQEFLNRVREFDQKYSKVYADFWMVTPVLACLHLLKFLRLLALQDIRNSKLQLLSKIHLQSSLNSMSVFI